MRFRTLVVEDEQHARTRLLRLLEKWSSVLEIVGTADSGPDAVIQMQEKKPDLLFLDINLPGMDGFQALETSHSFPFVVFTTASDMHALEAFKAFAVGYLLKPIDEAALDESIRKLVAMTSHRPVALEGALAKLASQMGDAYPARIACKTGDRINLVETKDITYLQSDHKYTCIHTSGAKEYLTDAPLIELEKSLPPGDFRRIHRSVIVNLAWIQEIRRSHEGRMRVILRDASCSELQVSRLYTDFFRTP